MTLLQLTEPIFQYVCRLNRLARRGTTLTASGDTAFVSPSNQGAAAAGHGGKLDFSLARAEVKALFEELAAKAAPDHRLAHQTKMVELPLIFFIDSMVSESGLPFAAQWNQNRLAYERQELAGDEKFFDLLEETFNDRSDDATERLGVFYTCIGLGFTGIYFKQPEFLRKTMLNIASRLRHEIDSDQHTRICSETYDEVDTRDLIQPPSSRMLVVGMVFASFILAVVMSYIVLYHEASKTLHNSIQEVLQQDLTR